MRCSGKREQLEGGIKREPIGTALKHLRGITAPEQQAQAQPGNKVHTIGYICDNITNGTF